MRLKCIKYCHLIHSCQQMYIWPAIHNFYYKFRWSHAQHCSLDFSKMYYQLFALCFNGRKLTVTLQIFGPQCGPVFIVPVNHDGGGVIGTSSSTDSR